MTPTWTKWLWVGLFLIIIVPLLIWRIRSINDNSQKNEELKRQEELERQKDKIESIKTTWVWVVTKSVTISINGEYSPVYYLSKGEGLSFKNSTQPYCVENENGHSVCGEKGEDISPKLPRNDNNMELRFRTSNGENGEITLVYWEKVISHK